MSARPEPAARVDGAPPIPAPASSALAALADVARRLDSMEQRLDAFGRGEPCGSRSR